MRSRHIKKELSAYCNRELGVEESRRVSEHLLVCEGCREKYERIYLGARLAECVERTEAPEAIWDQLEKSLSRGPAAESPAGGVWARLALIVPSRRVFAMICVLVLAVAAAVLLLALRARSRSWKVVRLAGVPRIGSEPITGSGRLRVGEWIETDSKSKARLRPGNIGEVEMEPGSRVQMLSSQNNEYRLALKHGELKARISAPPRLFFVNTPTATAVDLGCAYTLQVDDSGGGRIEVTAGMVEFVANGTKSTIPAEAACVTRTGSGPGTPYFEDASEEFKAALNRFDSLPNWDQERALALDAVLAQARKRDSLTLWHLLSRVGGGERERVYNRLAGFVPPPQGVTIEGIMRLDQGMLESWFMETEPAWFE